MTDSDKIKNDIYAQLRHQYGEDPDSVPPVGKAILAILATTRYMDHYDAQTDMFTDMDQRTVAAEKIMDDVDARVYASDVHYQTAVMDLVPLEMVETAEMYSGLDDLARRMTKVLCRACHRAVNEEEARQGRPAIPFSEFYAGREDDEYIPPAGSTVELSPEVAAFFKGTD